MRSRDGEQYTFKSNHVCRKLYLCVFLCNVIISIAAHLEGGRDSAEAGYGDHEDSNLWTPSTLDLFLGIVRDHYPNLIGQGERRDVVWKDIHASIANHVSHCMCLWKHMNDSVFCSES